MGIGDGGLGIGDWGLGTGDWSIGAWKWKQCALTQGITQLSWTQE